MHFIVIFYSCLPIPSSLMLVISTNADLTAQSWHAAEHKVHVYEGWIYKARLSSFFCTYQCHCGDHMTPLCAASTVKFFKPKFGISRCFTELKQQMLLPRYFFQRTITCVCSCALLSLWAGWPLALPLSPASSPEFLPVMPLWKQMIAQPTRTHHISSPDLVDV